MKAIVDDVRIWTRNLTDKELKELNGFRSITELEKLTGRYLKIMKKIKSNKVKIDTPERNPDVGPKNEDGIEHPSYDEYLDSLARLKKSIYRWSEEAESASNFARQIAGDLKEDSESFAIFNKNVRNAKDEFYILLRKSPSLQGLTVSGGLLKGQKISKLDSEVVITKEQSERLGSITNRFYHNESRSAVLYNSLIHTMLENDLFKAETPGAFIFAMIIGDKELHEKLASSNRYPELIKGLKRDLSQ